MPVELDLAEYGDAGRCEKASPKVEVIFTCSPDAPTSKLYVHQVLVFDVSLPNLSQYIHFSSKTDRLILRGTAVPGAVKVHEALSGSMGACSLSGRSAKMPPIMGSLLSNLPLCW
jgi:hypothetical protein